MGEVMGVKPHYGIGALIRGGRAPSSLSLCHVRKLGQGLRTPQPCRHPDLGLPSADGSSKCVVLEPLGLWLLIAAAHCDRDTG